MTEQARKEITLPQLQGDLLMLRIARSVAQDQLELPDILKFNNVTPDQWAVIERHPQFQKYLQQEIVSWNDAMNTPERVKIKSAAMVEEWLPEAFTQMHNQEVPLLHRNDLAKLVARLGGMDKGTVGVDGSAGERFHVTINLGADTKITYDKEVPVKTINHDEDETTKVWGSEP